MSGEERYNILMTERENMSEKGKEALDSYMNDYKEMVLKELQMINKLAEYSSILSEMNKKLDNHLGL